MTTPELTPRQEMLQRYRNVFGTSEGRIVLGDILIKCHFGLTLDPDNPSMIAEYNIGLVIATDAGLLDSLYTQLGLELRKE